MNPLLFFAAVLSIQASGAGAPTPVLRVVGCAASNSGGEPGLGLELRNLHQSPLVGWVLERRDPEEPREVVRRSVDVLLAPPLWVLPGASWSHHTSWPCTASVDVVAAVYENGDASGVDRVLDDFLAARQAKALGLREVLEALQRADLAADGLRSPDELRSMLASMNSPHIAAGRMAVRSALAGDEYCSPLVTTRPGANAPVVPRARIVWAIQSALISLEESLVQTRRRP